MEQTKQPVPREAIDAYNKYIHGEIDRRAFMDRVKKVAVSTAAAAAIVDQLMPNYAAAQQVSPTDSRLKTERAEVPSPNGNGSIKGYLARPANAGTHNHTKSLAKTGNDALPVRILRALDRSRGTGPGLRRNDTRAPHDSLRLLRSRKCSSASSWVMPNR